MRAPLDERTYRHLLDETMRRIDAAFEPVDPDLAEVALGDGTLTVTFRGGLRLMLTPQPPVRQLWVAFRDRAWHMDWDADQQVWLDDRGRGDELGALVARLTAEHAGVTIQVQGARVGAP